MQDRLKALMESSPITGVAMAAIENNAFETFSFGEYQGVTLSGDSVWRVASLTKPVFTYGILQLVQQGLLDLDRPLQAYLPKPYLDNIDHLAQMTARHAMSHTTGLPNWRDSNGLRCAFAPGTRFSYSSEGLNYLQYVAEYLLGQSMADYLQTTIFTPLNMVHSTLAQETETSLPQGAHFLLTTLPANGALSLQTTIKDYARFVMSMFDGALSPLSDQWRQTMYTPQIVVGDYPDLHWGLGWGLQTEADMWSFWHWGARSIPTAMNFVVGYPSQSKALIIFTNHRDGLWLCRQIANLYFPKRSMPAFNWLLPAENWRADGSRSH